MKGSTETMITKIGDKPPGRGEAMLAAHRRRREAAHRLPPLDCGCRDPWTCRHHDGPQTERQLDAYVDAAEHLLDLCLTPGPNIPALQRMRRRGGDGLKLAMRIRERWELAA